MLHTRQISTALGWKKWQCVIKNKQIQSIKVNTHFVKKKNIQPPKRSLQPNFTESPKDNHPQKVNDPNFLFLIYFCFIPFSVGKKKYFQERNQNCPNFRERTKNKIPFQHLVDPSFFFLFSISHRNSLS